MASTSESPQSITQNYTIPVIKQESLSITGDRTHGSLLTVQDPQSRFGSRETQLFRHWQVGSEILLNGTASSAENGVSVPDTVEVWSGISDNVEITSANLRHARIDQQYRAFGKGSLVNSKAFDNIGAGDKFYFAKWANAGCNFQRAYVLGFLNLTGTFNTSADRSRGEPVTLSLVGGGTKTGYITSIINSVLTLEIDGGSGGAATIEGATVTGAQSGATLVIDTSTIYGSTAATKIARIYSGGIPSGLGISVVTSHNGGLIDVDEYGDTGYVGSSANDYSNQLYSTDPGNFHLYELEIDFSGATGSVRQRIDNKVVYEVSGLSKTYLSAVKGFFLSNVGMDTSGLPVDVNDIGLTEYWGEIIADNSLKRLVIGDSNTLDTCNHIEIQKHTSWGEGIVQFQLNQGSFSDLTGKYLFLVDAGFSEVFSAAL